ncbi:MAG: hypothetical protein GTN75_06045 [Gemmatimonadetes bacterium]|nr:hypothetical protein [Gemmatimonadota bacterium]
MILDDPAYEKWWTWGWEAGLTSTIRIDENEFIDGAKSLRIEPKGGTNWYFIVANSPLPMTVGKDYTASFWVKAEAPRALSTKMKATDNSVDWGLTDFQVTTEWAEYHWTSKAVNAEAKIEFHCSAVDTPFWLDFVNVYEGSYVPGLEPSGAGGQEKARNPDPKDGSVHDRLWAPLRWRAGDFAVLHDVYFGDSAEAVAAATPDDADLFAGRQATTMLSVGAADGFHPESLVPGQVYYWRVDEVNDADPASPWKGDVWSFRVRPLTAWKPFPPDGMKYVDPNQDLTWEKGMTVILHYIYFGKDLDTVTNATVLNYMSVATTYEPGPLELDTTYFWRIDEFVGAVTHKGDVWSFTTRGSGGGAKAEYFKNMDLSGVPALTRTDGSINFNWSAEVLPGAADNVSARWTANLEAPFTETYKLITTSDDGVRLWLDGRLVINNWTDHSASDDTASVGLVAGQVYSVRMEWYENTGGAVAQLSWESPTLPRQIIPQGWLQLPLRAAGPSPAHAAPHADQNPTLRWIAGDEATHHDVYFGDAAEAVADADATTADIYRGRQSAAVTSYEPGELEWGKTYYWRVDEINPADADSPWKGVTWSFTTADFLLVDDFEDYTDDPGNCIYQTWLDGWGYTDPVTVKGNDTGATVGHAQPPYAELRIVHGGYQAMPLDYNNADTPYYSEAERTWSAAQDWTADGVDTLTLFFRGRRGNGAEKLYVTLMDSTNKTATVVHPDPEAALASEWTEWSIPLQDFAGVNAGRIKKMVIGLGDRSNPTPGGAGLIYIDDIRVTRSQP